MLPLLDQSPIQLAVRQAYAEHVDFSGAFRDNVNGPPWMLLVYRR